MFGAPPVIETQVFARLPDKFRITGRRSAWIEARQHRAPDSFLEGPSFDRGGNLYCTDIPYGRIFKITPEGEVDLFFEYDGEPNGLKIHRDGRLFIADHRRGILVLDPTSRKIEPAIERAHTEGFRGCNDLFFARNGDLYFTDQGQTGLHDPSGRVYCLQANGNLRCLIRNVPSPNGLALNVEENILYVNVTRANAVWRLPFLPNGDVTKVGIFLQLSGGGGPDGLAIDAEGNLAVAHAGFGTVWLFSRIGEPLYRVKSCEGLTTTNLAYGGVDGKTLYITESATATILTARMPTAGHPMYSHT